MSKYYYTLIATHGDFLILFQMVSLPLINFLSRNKTGHQKLIYKVAGIAIVRHVLPFPQTNRAL